MKKPYKLLNRTTGQILDRYFADSFTEACLENNWMPGDCAVLNYREVVIFEKEEAEDFINDKKGLADDL